MHFETSGRRPQASKSEPFPPSRGRGVEVSHDTQTGMPLGIPRGARCVQRFDGSLNSAIHTTFRTFAAFFIDAKAKRSVVESCTLTRPVGLQTCACTRERLQKGAARPYIPNPKEALADGCTGVSG